MGVDSVIGGFDGGSQDVQHSKRVLPTTLVCDEDRDTLDVPNRARSEGPTIGSASLEGVSVHEYAGVDPNPSWDTSREGRGETSREERP